MSRLPSGGAGIRGSSTWPGRTRREGKQLTEIKYYRKYTGRSESIVDALIEVGVKDVSLEARKKIGKLNGIRNVGEASGNRAMLDLLKKGKLIKSKTQSMKYRDKFLGRLKVYDPVLKKYGAQIFYSFKSSEATFAKAKAKLKKGMRTGLTCVVPCRWALKDTGINPSGFYGKNGTFRDCYKGKVAKHLKRITSGSVIGLTVKAAVDQGLLKPGDILAFQGKTHTFVYTGKGYLVYDGGHAADYKNDGIIVDYSKHNAKCRISEVLRWKD